VVIDERCGFDELCTRIGRTAASLENSNDQSSATSGRELDYVQRSARRLNIGAAGIHAWSLGVRERCRLLAVGRLGHLNDSR